MLLNQLTNASAMTFYNRPAYCILPLYTITHILYVK